MVKISILKFVFFTDQEEKLPLTQNDLLIIYNFMFI